MTDREQITLENLTIEIETIEGFLLSIERDKQRTTKKQYRKEKRFFKNELYIAMNRFKQLTQNIITKDMKKS
tara:strand:+ start:160 stop:375 length:216 start_codon:yes stop_codon:yes gene_type:complete